MVDSMVRFIAKGCKRKIPSYAEYIEKIYRCLRFHDMIKNPLVDPELTRKCVEGSHEGETVVSYQIVYNYTVYGITDTWYVTFDFYDAGDETQLQVDITSHTYRINLDEEYLLKLKRLIEESIDSDWEIFVRVYDRYSDMLSTLLVPELHRVETVVRFVVFEVMRRAYGAQWWKEYGEGFFDTHDGIAPDTVADRYDGEYAVSDEYFTTMNVKDFDKVIDMEWDEHFSKYFTDEFREGMHSLAAGREKIVNKRCMDREFYELVRTSIELVSREASDVLWKLEHTS